MSVVRYGVVEIVLTHDHDTTGRRLPDYFQVGTFDCRAYAYIEGTAEPLGCSADFDEAVEIARAYLATCDAIEWGLEPSNDCRLCLKRPVSEVLRRVRAGSGETP